MSKLLYYDNFKNFGKVILYNKQAGTVTAFAKSEFSFGMRGEYSTPWEMEKQQQLSALIQAGQYLASSFRGGDLSQIQLKDIRQSISSWTGSSRPDFNLDLLFVAVREGYDVRAQAKILLAGVCPTGGYLTMKAPCGYGPYDGGGKPKAKGTWSLQIGTWFKANNLIMKSCDLSFSKECLPNGWPLYCIAKTTLEPFYTPMKDDVYEYFQG